MPIYMGLMGQLSIALLNQHWAVQSGNYAIPVQGWLPLKN